MLVDDSVTLMSFTLPFGVSNLAHQEDLVDREPVRRLVAGQRQ